MVRYIKNNKVHNGPNEYLLELKRQPKVVIINDDYIENYADYLYSDYYNQIPTVRILKTSSRAENLPHQSQY